MLTPGIVADEIFVTQLLVLYCGIAVIMTAGVYNLVAGIVKLDDAGVYPAARRGRCLAAIPALVRCALLAFAPWLMKTLGIVGTVAMFRVGGGILVHGFHLLADWSVLVTGPAATAPASARCWQRPPHCWYRCWSA